MIADPAAFSMALLMKFALGYFAILATPGPNMFTIGTMAALRGFRAALPFCLGVALGADRRPDRERLRPFCAVDGAHRVSFRRVIRKCAAMRSAASR